MQNYIRKYNKEENMEWKEVLKVSIITGAITYFAVNSSDYTNLGNFVSQEAFEAVTFLGGMLVTGFILNRKLSRKSDWGIFIGIVITWLVPLVLHLLVHLL